MFPFKNPVKKFNRIDTPMSKKEEVMYSNILPSTNRMTQNIHNDIRRMETAPMCVVQGKLHTCNRSSQAFQPFTNFFQLRQSQDMLNRQWNDFNIEKKMKNMEKQRAKDDSETPLNQVPYYNMFPVCTSGTKPNLIDPTRVNF